KGRAQPDGGDAAVGDVDGAGDRCFFFQAEDGIRDGHVTGVQTCALPIFKAYLRSAEWTRRQEVSLERTPGAGVELVESVGGKTRSEERRVGKECRSRGAP